MKRILALSLILICVFAVSSCTLIDSLLPKELEVPESIADTQAIIDASKPKSAEVAVAFDSSLGKLEGHYNVTYNDDGTASVKYKYELFETIDINASSTATKSVEEGEVTIAADGTVSGDLGGVASLEALTFHINLGGNKLVDPVLEAGILTAKVAAVNTAEVLGVELGYNADFVIVTGNGRVNSVAIFYATDYGPVEIKAVYSY